MQMFEGGETGWFGGILLRAFFRGSIEIQARRGQVVVLRGFYTSFPFLRQRYRFTSKRQERFSTERYSEHIPNMTEPIVYTDRHIHHYSVSHRLCLP